MSWRASKVFSPRSKEGYQAMVQPWSKIRSHYADRVALGPAFESMLKLISEVELSRYASGLFAWTSMHDLCIVQTPVTYPYHGPYLRISPSMNGQLAFRYVDTFNEDKQWPRTVEGNEGFARLESFIDQLHWFVWFCPKGAMPQSPGLPLRLPGN